MQNPVLIFLVWALIMGCALIGAAVVAWAIGTALLDRWAHYVAHRKRAHSPKGRLYQPKGRL